MRTKTTLITFLCIIFFASNIYAQISLPEKQVAHASLQRAKNYFTAGDYKKCMNELNNVFQIPLSEDQEIQQDLREGHLLMGQCLEKEKRYAEAKYHYKRVLAMGYQLNIPETETIRKARQEKEIFDFANRRFDEGKVKVEEAKFDKADSIKLMQEAENLYHSADNLVATLLNGDLYNKDRLDPLFLKAIIAMRFDNKKEAENLFLEILRIDNHYQVYKPASRFTTKEQDLFEDMRKKFDPSDVKSDEQGSGKKKWLFIVGGAAAGILLLVLLR